MTTPKISIASVSKRFDSTRGESVTALEQVRQIVGRDLIVYDSFEGLPPPSPGDQYAKPEATGLLAAKLELVQENVRSLGAIDRCTFRKGWFSDTLPTAPIDKIAVLRLDGDMYASTMDALNALYPRLSPGGFVIVDYYAMRSSRTAVHDYLDRRGEKVRFERIDDYSVWWRKD